MNYKAAVRSVDVVGGEAGENDGNNQTVETESLSENEDEDHTNVDVFLGVSTNTSVTGNTDSETGGEGGETAAKTGSEVLVAVVGGVLPGAHGDVVEGSLLDYSKREMYHNCAAHLPLDWRMTDTIRP